MFLNKAGFEDIDTLEELYKIGFNQAKNLGVEVWEFPDRSFIEELLPLLYIVRDRKIYGNNILCSLCIISSPNLKIWNEEAEDKEYLYFSKLVVSQDGLGYLSTTAVLRLLFEEFGNHIVLRWDILESNENLLNYYLSLGALNNGSIIFKSQKRQEDISLVRLSLTFDMFIDNII